MTSTKLTVALLLATALGASSAMAYDADWKRGRVYYRQVCTACHQADAGKSIAPNEKTKAEWSAYFKADKHNKGKDTVAKYMGKAYRASVAGSNKAAAKFVDVPDQEMTDDVVAFVLRGAKDGDAPAGCN